jgi:regulator of sigma E protease
MDFLSSVGTFFHNFWWLLVLIGVMIIIHELGHYWAARFFDVRVETFSFGFGPRLFGFKRGETDFRFSAILFGGYVKMAGEQPGEENANDPRSFQAKPRWQRLIIAFAGPFMNIVLAVGLLTGLYMVHYPKLVVDDDSTIVGYVLPDSPAHAAGIQDGDRIVAFDGATSPKWDDVLMKELTSAGKALPVTIERDGQRIDLTITPKFDEKRGIGFIGWGGHTQVRIADVWGKPAKAAGMQPGDLLLSIDGRTIYSRDRVNEVIRESGGGPVTVDVLRDKERLSLTVTPEMTEIEGETRYMIGVSMESPVEYVSLPFTQALMEAVETNIRTTVLIGKMIVGIVEQRMSAKSLEGPIRIAQISGDAARQGPLQFLSLMAMVSLNLAIFNLLPIPVLDGGLILVLLIEMVMRRDMSLAVKETVFKVGFVFLMMVVVFVLYNDLTKVLMN